MKTFLSAAIAAGLIMGASALACSSSESSTPAAAVDGGGSDGAPSEAATGAEAASDATPAEAAPGDGGGACHDVKNTAPEATSTTVKGNAPAATGGTIGAGTYFLTDFTLYDPDGTPSAPEPSGMKTTLVVTGNVMNSVMDLGDGVDRTFSETFTVNGTDLDRVLTCPKPGPDLDAVYSVNGKNLVIFETDPQSSLVAGSTYVKQ